MGGGGRWGGGSLENGDYQRGGPYLELGRISQKTQYAFGPKGKFSSQNLLNGSTAVLISQTSQFCFVN